MTHLIKHDNCRACEILGDKDVNSLPHRNIQIQMLNAVAEVFKKYPLRLAELRKVTFKDLKSVQKEMSQKNGITYSFDNSRNKCNFQIQIRDRPIEFWGFGKDGGPLELCMAQTCAQLQHIYGFEAHMGWTPKGGNCTMWTYFVELWDVESLYDGSPDDVLSAYNSIFPDLENTLENQTKKIFDVFPLCLKDLSDCKTNKICDARVKTLNLCTNDSGVNYGYNEGKYMCAYKVKLGGRPDNKNANKSFVMRCIAKLEKQYGYKSEMHWSSDDYYAKDSAYFTLNITFYQSL